jgi:hypothetical protein
MSTFSGQVSQSSDDGTQTSSGSVSVTTTVAVVSTGSWQAFRFQNVTIPSGATISSASISIWPTTAKSIDSTIYGNKVANPATLSTTTSYISGLAETAASVNWIAGPFTAGAFVASPDISAIITELIGQAGWASGNSMIFILENFEALTSAATIEMYDGSPSEAAELSVTYTTSGVPGTPTGLTVGPDATNQTTSLDLGTGRTRNGISF